MLVRLAWRNVWRNRRRSLIVVTAAAVGIVASITIDSLSMGIIMRILDVQIASHIAHVQIAAAGYADNPLVQRVVPDMDAAADALVGDDRITAWAPRVVAQGLAASAASSTGVLITGIDPDREAHVTTISRQLVEGGYLRGRPREVVVGRTLADKLHLGVGGKLVLMSSQVGGEVGSELFRIVGIFETFSADFDRSFAYVSLDDARRLVALGNHVSTIAVRVHDERESDAVAHALHARLGNGYEARSYRSLVPMLVMYVDMARQTFVAIYAIVGIALLFGIVNTMLMAVYERIRECGVLMAMGMKPRAVFTMFMTEAAMLGVGGALLGLAGGLAIYVPLARFGLDLSAFSAALRGFGTNAVIHPVLTVEEVVSVLVVIPLFTLIGALVPALRAARLVPVHAIRHV